MRPKAVRLSDAAIIAASTVVAAAAFEIDLWVVKASGRGSVATTTARHVAFYLAHCIGGCSYSAIAREFNRDRTGVAHGVARVEDRRDDPDFDAILSRCEAQIVSLANPPNGDIK